MALLTLLLLVSPAQAQPVVLADFQSLIDSPERVGGGAPMFSFPMTAGVSSNFVLGVVNGGGTTESLEVYIVFTGQVDQTGQIDAPGFDCEVRHDSGINAAIRCTTPAMPLGEYYSIRFQGRGLAAGTGKIGAVLNPGRTVVESDYDNNNFTVEVSVQ